MGGGGNSEGFAFITNSHQSLACLDSCAQVMAISSPHIDFAEFTLASEMDFRVLMVLFSRR